MTRYIYKKVHIDKRDPTDTVSIPDDAIHVDVKYGVHDIPGHMTVQWLAPILVKRTYTAQPISVSIETQG